jgi:hypothetical protein
MAGSVQLAPQGSHSSVGHAGLSVSRRCSHVSTQVGSVGNRVSKVSCCCACLASVGT